MPQAHHREPPRRSSTAERINTFVNWPPADRWIFARAWLYLLIERLRLSLTPRTHLGMLIARVARESATRADAETIARSRHEMGILNRAANVHPIRPNCLLRSLTGYRMLVRHGTEPVLRIGVAYDDKRSLRAHAWLELSGVVINDAEDISSRFTPLTDAARLPRRVASWR